MAETRAREVCRFIITGRLIFQTAFQLFYYVSIAVVDFMIIGMGAGRGTIYILFLFFPLGSASLASIGSFSRFLLERIIWTIPVFLLIVCKRRSFEYKQNLYAQDFLRAILAIILIVVTVRYIQDPCLSIGILSCDTSSESIEEIRSEEGESRPRIAPYVEYQPQVSARTAPRNEYSVGTTGISHGSVETRPVKY